MKKLLLTSLLALVCPFLLVAQDPLKWGKIDQEDLEMSIYSPDPDAAAVVLADYGSVRFNYRSPDGIKIEFDRHVRVKVLKKSGLDQADVEIPIYRKGEELVGSVKGITYNLVDGKVQEDKLDKGQVFTQEMNDYYDMVKFSMPNVKEGSVLEYKYTVSSEYIFTLVSWEFQRDIPTRWSELRAEIPEFFTYKTLMSGYLPLTIINSTSATDIDRNKVTRFHWAIEHVPALKEEKFVTTMSDYTSKIEFELQTIDIPGRVFEHVSHTWEKLNDDLNKSESFGKQIGKGRHLSDWVAEVTVNADGPKEKAKLITRFIRNNIKYNGKKRMYTSKSNKKVLEEKSGNSADINLLLVSMLQEAGLEANPVILSTRENGRVNYTPLLQDFNYVIAHVKLGEEELLLDGTDPDLPYDMLPYYCLNQQGRLISPAYTSWVDLKNNERLKELVSGVFGLSPEGDFSGELKYKESGYVAKGTREKIKADGKEKYLEAVKGNHADWTINSYENSNFENVEQDLEEVFNLELASKATVAADKIYFQPMLAGSEKENPFKLEKREYPVDFGCPIEEMYMYTISLPEGFKVEELPESAFVALPNKGGSFRYNISNLGDKISVMSILRIDKPMFVGEEYAYLKEFYNLIVTKQAEQVVLTKVN